VNDKILIDHLKEFHSTEDTSNFNLLDFLSAFGSPLQALNYSYLFWPDFVEFEDMIFHQCVIEDEQDRSRIRAARVKLSTRREVEESFNQFLIPNDFFAAGQSTTTEEENLHLARRMTEMWRAQLARLVPTRKCVVKLQLPDENQEGPTIVVYQA